MIVYSPEGSPGELFDENYQDPDVEVFVQKESCFVTSPALAQCQECMRDENCDKYSCRFHQFRKIEKDSEGNLRVAGFLDPHTDPTLDGKRKRGL